MYWVAVFGFPPFGCRPFASRVWLYSSMGGYGFLSFSPGMHPQINTPALKLCVYYYAPNLRLALEFFSFSLSIPLSLLPFRYDKKWASNFCVGRGDRVRFAHLNFLIKCRSQLLLRKKVYAVVERILCSLLYIWKFLNILHKKNIMI